MKITRLHVLAVACMLLLTSAASALPIVSASANTIPAGTFMLDVWSSWLDFTVSWQEDGNGGSGWVGFTEERQWTAGSLVPRIYYGVTDWLTVRAALPLEDQYRQYDLEEPAKSATGLGDIIIDPKIQLFRGESGYPRVAALVGVRFPTGGADGDIPLSDGSTDYMVGGVITHQEGAITGHACLTYWLNGDRESGGDVPDLIAALATIEAPLDESWNLLWEFKGVFGQTPSEFYRTYACPGIMWNGDNLNIGVSALISASARGKVGVSALDYDWAPYVRVYYRFF
ncbi:MAG: transporter [Candidatus Eisenbacteria bacterium]